MVNIELSASNVSLANLEKLKNLFTIEKKRASRIKEIVIFVYWLYFLHRDMFRLSYMTKNIENHDENTREAVPFQKHTNLGLFIEICSKLTPISPPKFLLAQYVLKLYTKSRSLNLKIRNWQLFCLWWNWAYC